MSVFSLIEFEWYNVCPFDIYECFLFYFLKLAPGSCQIWGDPHYVTFDDKKYNFQGDCDYTLVRDCQNFTDFHLWSNNERQRPSAKVSFLREVVLDLRGIRYSLQEGGRVQVDGVTIHPPYIDGQVLIVGDATPVVSS